MSRIKNRKYPDLPERSDPNYNKLYREKCKQELKAKAKVYYKNRYPLIKDDEEFKEERRIRSAEYREKNPGYFREKSWERHGIIDITYEKYLEELEKQEGKCKICHEFMCKPHVDHDHITGKYRGLLCQTCNFSLGKYEKYKELFEDYLSEIS